MTLITLANDDDNDIHIINNKSLNRVHNKAQQKYSTTAITHNLSTP